MYMYIYVSEFEKRGNFVQNLIFQLSAERERAFNKLHFALCSKSIAPSVPEIRVHEYRARVEWHFEKWACKDRLPGKIH